MEPSSTGRRRRLSRSTHRRSQGSRDTAGKVVPAGTVAVVRSSDFLRASEKATAISTLIRQRRLTPSCGGHAPTAERTVGPARIAVESLTPRPGIREHPDPELENRIGPFQPRRLSAFVSAVGSLAAAPVALSARRLVTLHVDLLLDFSATQDVQRASICGASVDGLLNLNANIAVHHDELGPGQQHDLTA